MTTAVNLAPVAKLVQLRLHSCRDSPHVVARHVRKGSVTWTNQWETVTAEHLLVLFGCLLREL